MTVSLTPELDEYVEKQVKSGRYRSNSEVIRAGLRALADQDMRSWLQEGLDALERGDRVEAKTAIGRLRERLQQPLASRLRDDESPVPGLRFANALPAVLIYKVLENGDAEVVRIAHGRQDLPSLLGPAGGK